MTVIANQLTIGVGESASSFNTASIAPVGNRLVLVGVGNIAASPNEPTISGASMTWTKVTTVVKGTSFRFTVFRGLSSSPGSGALTIDFSGQSQTIASWTAAEFGNVVPTGTNGADAIQQSGTVNQAAGGGTAPSITLSAFNKPANATYGASFSNTGGTTFAGGNFTQLSNNSGTTLGTAAGGGGLQSQWSSNNQTTVNWTMSDDVDFLGIGIEIVAQELGGGFIFNLL